MMNRNEAEVVASRLLSHMRPHCHRIEVAGSIRRLKQVGIKDVEMVLIPKWEKREAAGNLFEAGTESVNLLHEWALDNNVVRWIKTGTPERIPWIPKAGGKQWKGLTQLPSGEEVPVDVFLCSLDTWGAIMAIRTGPGDFSRELVTYANQNGFKFHEGRLYYGSTPLITPEEENVFAALGLRMPAPQERGLIHDIRRLRLKP